MEKMESAEKRSPVFLRTVRRELMSYRFSARNKSATVSRRRMT
jgi:hypothetical protein